MIDVEISLKARDQLEALPQDVQDRIKRKLLNDVTEDPERYLRSLSNFDAYSIRIGDYRALVDYDPDNSTIRITAVKHRSTVYDRELED